MALPAMILGYYVPTVVFPWEKMAARLLFFLPEDYFTGVGAHCLAALLRTPVVARLFTRFN